MSFDSPMQPLHFVSIQFLRSLYGPSPKEDALAFGHPTAGVGKAIAFVFNKSKFAKFLY
ncbi:MAG: hypothetical protein V7L20_01450 [Nostoc sp.]|uniref:hypothetical protein n=1 Tax=Nostoc sp. TaxID=1180 RepID=UPI002FF687A9